MPNDARDLARRLARDAEAVCRRYLSAGRREGRYWLVGDIHNTPGRSMFVRLSGPDSGPGAVGHWTDAATGEHGDLLDLIRLSLGSADFRAATDEARSFLGRPAEGRFSPPFPRPPSNSRKAACRLFAASRPIAGTVVETYLRNRGITDLRETAALRFHPRCYHRSSDHAPIEVRPAMIAVVTALDGTPTGVLRTWLASGGSGKAPVAVPRRALGDLLGHAVRFGTTVDTMAAGEGIETMLSLRMALPRLPMVAALSAAHLAALVFGPGPRRLYIAVDADPAGLRARDVLTERASAAGIEAIPLSPTLGDFNDDLRHLGLDALRAAVRVQIAPEDVARFMASP